MGPASMFACDGSDYLPSRRTLSPVQGVETIFTRTSVLGRLVAFAIAGGVLAAAMVIPVVAATGVLVRNEPDKGGSTIAQQYVKNVLLLEAEKAENSQALKAANASTLSRKLNELRMAVAAEHQQSKQDILAGYLNNAYFGNLAYGIETAAETYFGTTAAKLSVTQAATLAGIVENPHKYDPVKN